MAAGLASWRSSRADTVLRSILRADLRLNLASGSPQPEESCPVQYPVQSRLSIARAVRTQGEPSLLGSGIRLGRYTERPLDQALPMLLSRLALLSCCLLAFSHGSRAAEIGGSPEEHVDAARGFRIDVPEGWRKVEGDTAVAGHVLRLLPPGSAGQRAVTVAIKDAAAGDTDEVVRQRSLVALDLLPQAEIPPEFFERELGGVERLGLRSQIEQGGAVYHVEQLYVVESGLAYTLQVHAPDAEFGAAAEELYQVLAGFVLVERPKADAAALRLSALANRCGE
ncbi:MAG: hypothetical protein ACI9HE_003552, partial [Planctomycetota bacterium]